MQQLTQIWYVSWGKKDKNSCPNTSKSNLVSAQFLLQNIQFFFFDEFQNFYTFQFCLSLFFGKNWALESTNENFGLKNSHGINSTVPGFGEDRWDALLIEIYQLHSQNDEKTLFCDFKVSRCKIKWKSKRRIALEIYVFLLILAHHEKFLALLRVAKQAGPIYNYCNKTSCCEK